MAISMDDLDDDDIIQSQEPERVNQDPPVEPPTEDTFMSDFLKTRGINDMSKILFEGENGLEEKSWDSLSQEEKFGILNTPLEQPISEDNNNDLSEDEINFINILRENNLTPQQYIEQIQNPAPEPQYQVDDLDDDQLFVLDLETRVGDLPDEVAAQALATAKQNEDLFKKQVEGIRKEYKEKEDYQKQQEQAEVEEQRQQAYQEFANSVSDAISQFESVGNFDLNLDDRDREILAGFMLERDEAGNNYLWQALQDPETLTKAAWFILNGEEALNDISEHYAKQIQLISDNQYKKGFEDAKKGNQPSRPTVVIDPSKSKTNQVRQYTSIEELDDED